MAHIAENLGAGNTSSLETAGASRKRLEEGLSISGSFFQLFSGAMSRSLNMSGADAGVTAAQPSASADTQGVQPLHRDKSSPIQQQPGRNVEARNRDHAERTENKRQPERSQPARENSRRTERKAETTAEKQQSEKTSARKVETTGAEKRSAAETDGRATSARATAKGNANLQALQNQTDVTDKPVKEIIEATRRASESIRKAQSKADAPTAVRQAKTQQGAENKVVPFRQHTVENRSQVRNADVRTFNSESAGANAVKGADTARGSQQSQAQNQSSGGNNLAQAHLNQAAAAQVKTASAQTGKTFSSAMKAAAATEAASAAAKSSGNTATLPAASVQYSRAGTHVVGSSKVAPPPHAKPAEVISQVIKAAKISVQGGREEMRILLKPAELGWLKVRIAVEGQRVTAHFHAENEYVRGLIESNSSQLQQALSQHNLRVTHVQVDVHDPGTGTGQGGRADNGGSANGDSGTSGNSHSQSSSDEQAAENSVVLPDTAAQQLSAVDVMI